MATSRSRSAAADVKVTSILSNPDQDPHLFEASPSVARALSAAPIVVYNGADYDPWMEKLLAAAPGTGRRSSSWPTSSAKKPGDNPHIWYDPRDHAGLRQGAGRRARPNAIRRTQAEYQQRLGAVRASLQPIQAKIAALRTKLAGTPVTATEPVFGYMVAALGMQMRNERFQLAVMNDTEPSASDVAAFENDLRNASGAAAGLQQPGDATRRRSACWSIAKPSHVPVVGVDRDRAGRQEPTRTG